MAVRKSKAKPVVGILMGSDSDWSLIKTAATTFDEFGVSYEVRVMSAHRTPDLAAEYSASAASRGLKVVLAAAGGAAHLAGVLAAHTILPVIGIPVAGGALNGLDALLATVQMPAGIPVATVALGSAGPVNAAILAVQILATSDLRLARRLQAHKAALKKKVAAGNERVQADLASSR
jgi:phosphoribosylaminoimidazole carboxylase PurE protein